jgi:GNAT superfamily N-acetyltransferase
VPHQPPLTIQRLTRTDAHLATEALDAWAPLATYGGYLQSGDIGWALRLDDDDVDGLVRLVRRGDEPVAVLMLDGPALRSSIRPDSVHDLKLAELLVEQAEALPSDNAPVADAQFGSTMRSLLSARGWRLDPSAWVVLYRPLTAADGRHTDELCTTLGGEADVADRVEVQRAAFERSTFTVARWHQMAAGPTYDPRLEWLRRTVDGEPAAGATGWSAGPGKCGLLEPVGTHPRHRGAGHGVAVSMAAIAALARLGASGVTVITPADNTAAVRTYEACGLRPVEYSFDMVRDAA